MREHASPQDSAKLLRKALKAAFPGVRFSCRMSRGTAWGNYHVDWTDGPSESAVNKVTAPFQGQSFDGMDDSTHYHDKPLGIAKDGTPLLSGIGLLICQRSISAERMAEAAAELRSDGYAGCDLNMACAARMVANGAVTHVAAKDHGLRRVTA